MAKTDKLKKTLSEFSKAATKLSKLNAEVTKANELARKSFVAARDAMAVQLNASKTSEEREYWQTVLDSTTINEMTTNDVGAKVALSFAKSIDKNLKAAQKTAATRIAAEKKAAEQAKKDEAAKKAAEKKAEAERKKAEAKAAKDADKQPATEPVSEAPKQIDLAEAIESAPATTTAPPAKTVTLDI